MVKNLASAEIWSRTKHDEEQIGNFDKTPCKDPHVENTSEIGRFEILKVKKTGKNSYRFDFKVARAAENNQNTYPNQ